MPGVHFIDGVAQLRKTERFNFGHGQGTLASLRIPFSRVSKTGLPVRRTNGGTGVGLVPQRGAFSAGGSFSEVACALIIPPTCSAKYFFKYSRGCHGQSMLR